MRGAHRGRFGRRTVVDLAAVALVSLAAVIWVGGREHDQGRDPEQDGLEIKTGQPPADSSCTGFNRPCFEGEPEDGGRIVFGLQALGDPAAEDSLDPASLLPHPSAIVAGAAIYDPLVTVDDGDRYSPSLATRWDNTPDLESWTLTLRPGVVFHDGTAFDADAVVRHFNRLKFLGEFCPCFPAVEPIGAVETLDAATVRFHLSEPDPFFLSVLAGPAGFVASPTATDRWGLDYARHPVGTGPFGVQGFDSLGETVVLERNPRYWRTDDQGRRLPYLDQIAMRPVSDARKALEAGDIEILHPWETALTLEAERSGRWGVQKATDGQATAAFFNPNRPPFDDIRARRAVAYALDRSEVIEALDGGVAQPALGLYPPGSPFHADDVAWPDHDPQKARQLVQEIERDGEEVTFTFTCNDPDQSAAFDTMQAQLAEVGIEMRKRILDSGEYLNAVLGGDGDYQAACWTRPDSVQDLRLQFHTFSVANLVGYNNHIVDDASEDIHRTTDPEAHERLVHLIEEQLAEDIPMLPLWRHPRVTIYDRDLSGISLPRHPLYGDVDLATLYVKR